jgi:hypothetical protein
VVPGKMSRCSDPIPLSESRHLTLVFR